MNTIPRKIVGGVALVLLVAVVCAAFHEALGAPGVVIVVAAASLWFVLALVATRVFEVPAFAGPSDPARARALETPLFVAFGGLALIVFALPVDLVLKGYGAGELREGESLFLAVQFLVCSLVGSKWAFAWVMASFGAIMLFIGLLVAAARSGA